MSQAGIINVAGGGGGGSPIQTLTGDSGGPVPPTANNIFVLGGTSSANNTNGITVSGNPGTSTETFTLTNRLPATTTTSDGAGQTKVLLSYPLGATPGTYLFHFDLVAYNVTDALCSGYSYTFTTRTTGAAAAFVGLTDIFATEETTMSGVVVNPQLNAVANTLTITVTGINTKTINWSVLLTYILVN